jgi:hypothetical protein
MSSDRGVVAVVHAWQCPQVAGRGLAEFPRASPDCRDAAIGSVTVHAAGGYPPGAGLTRTVGTLIGLRA